MLDAVVLSDLQKVIFPPWPPAIDTSWVSRHTAETERRLQALVDAYADLAKIWRDRMAEIRRRLIAQFPPQPADDRELQQLGAAIQEIEELAESRAAESSRQFKKRNRYIGRFDASMARIYGHAAEQL
ncbi:MAG: hypothetical protein JO163_02630, partial [Methylobacteriaceae bacterium]|nr:hypothetical protein [Methylobacteriaceae bacterium]